MAYSTLCRTAAAARYACDHYMGQLKDAYAERLRAIESSYQLRHGAVRTAYAAVLGGAQTNLEQIDHGTQERPHDLTAAYRWAVAAWADPSWHQFVPLIEAPIPQSVRVGDLLLVGGPDLAAIPALAQLVQVGHLFITGTPEAQEAAVALLRSVVLRLLVSSVPGTVRLALFDPASGGSNLAQFRRLPTQISGSKISCSAKDVDTQLDALQQHVETVIQTRLLRSDVKIEDYNRDHPEQAVPYHVVAVCDFPVSFSDRAAQAFGALARMGPRAGVYLVVHINEAYPLPRDFDLDALTVLGTTLRCAAPNRMCWDDPEFGAHDVAPDGDPPGEQIEFLLDALSASIRQISAVLPFSRLAVPPTGRWKGSTQDGIRVPIGMTAAGEIHYLELGRPDSVVQHGLIGGMPRSGKTNLLHTLILQMALLYPPQELDLYLVDFREGVEFQGYVDLPHARAVALETEREFGLSIVRRIKEVIEERGQLFKPVGVTTLPEYRQATGAHMPRVVVIIDEFQVLFADDDPLAREASRIFEDIVRRGAAFGLHLLLSSQSPSVSGVYGKTIYNQMGLRIALRCHPPEAQAILGEGNDAAAHLERSGDAIYNDEVGHRDKNVLVRICHASLAERRGLLNELQVAGQDAPFPRPITFEGRTPARLDENDAFQESVSQRGWSRGRASAQVWLGQPIELKPPTAATLERYMRSNLLIMGGGDADAYGLLLAALLSLAAQRSPEEAVFWIIDFSRPNTSLAGLFAHAQSALPHRVELIGPRRTGDVLAELVDIAVQRVTDGTPSAPSHYILIAGLHRWRELRSGDPFNQSDAAKQLTRLAEDGPDVAMHLIAWADGFGTIERTFKRPGVGNFDLRAILRVPEADSNALLGSPAAARLQDNRAYFRHEDWELGRLEKFKPYALPEEAALLSMLAALQRK